MIEDGIAANGMKHLVRKMDCPKLTITLIGRHVFDHNETFSDILTWCLFFFSSEKAMQYQEFWNVISWLTIDDREELYSSAKQANFDSKTQQSRDNDSIQQTFLWYNGILKIIQKYKQKCLDNIDKSNHLHKNMKCELDVATVEWSSVSDNDKFTFEICSDDVIVDEFDQDKRLIFEM